MQCEKVHEGETLKAVLSGRCTFSSYQYFESIIAEVKEGKCNRIELLLDKLEYIDSSGLGIMLMLNETCEENNVKIVLKNPSAHVLRVLRATRLDTLFAIES